MQRFAIQWRNRMKHRNPLKQTFRHQRKIEALAQGSQPVRLTQRPGCKLSMIGQHRWDSCPRRRPMSGKYGVWPDAVDVHCIDLLRIDNPLAEPCVSRGIAPGSGNSQAWFRTKMADAGWQTNIRLADR